MVDPQEKGFAVESMPLVTSGVVQFQCGVIPKNKGSLTKWTKSADSGSYGYGYTNGFMILANNMKGG